MLQPPGLLKSIEYGTIAVLRTLLLKIYKPQDWTKFMTLEHHNDERKNLPLWKGDEAVAKIIREQWNLGEIFSEDDVHIVSLTLTNLLEFFFSIAFFSYRYVEFMRSMVLRWEFSIP